jgi:hypothetical protein
MNSTIFRVIIGESNENSLTFRRNVQPPSSELKSKQRKQPARSGGYLFILLFSPEDGESTFLLNVGE